MNRFLRRGGFSLLLALALLLPAHFAAAQAQDDAAVLDRITAITAGAPALDERFRADEGNWELNESEDYALRYDGGSYRVDVPSPDQFVWGIREEFAAGDFYAEVDAYTIEGPENNQAGLVFRHADTDNFYVFAISADGQYELLRFDSGTWIEIVPRISSEIVNPGAGAVNRLGVLAEGPGITLLINGEVVEHVEDEGLPSGAIGLAAGAFEEGGVYAAFDDLRLWHLGEAGDVPTLELTAEPTEEPTEEPTAEPTEEPTTEALPEDAARLEEIRGGSPLLDEQFRRDTGAWSLDSDETVTYAITGRALNVQVVASNWMGWSVANDVSAGDLLYEADATLRSGPEDAEFGLLVRESPGDNGGNFYFFAVTGQGYYSFWKSVDGAWTELLPWTASDALAPGLGATNRLGVLAEGPTFTLFANDVPLAQVDDDTFAEGRVGLAVGTFDTGGAEVAFADVALWALDGGPLTLETPEPQPTMEPLPTLEPLPTVELPADVAEAAAELEAIRAGEPTFTDDFNRDRGDWGLTADEGVEHAYARRSFRIRINLDSYMSWSVNEALNAPDYLVEVDAALASGPASGDMGIVFNRVDDDNFYYFAVNTNRQFSLWQLVGGQWASVLPWIEASALNGGDATLNRIGVLKRGDEVRLLGNNFVLATITVDGAAGGDIGLAAETAGEPGVEVSFDNLEYWDLAQ